MATACEEAVKIKLILSIPVIRTIIMIAYNIDMMTHNIIMMTHNMSMMTRAMTMRLIMLGPFFPTERPSNISFFLSRNASHQSRPL